MRTKSPLIPDHNRPIEIYQVVADLTERDAIPVGVRHIGRECITANDGVKYRLIGGITNAHWSSITGDVNGYQLPFTNADLVSGYLTVTHDLNSLYFITHVTVMTNLSDKMEVDNIFYSSANNLVADFRMIAPISGTWTLLVTAISDKTIIIPPVINKTVRLFNTNEFNKITFN